jgi:hypothetical protein
MRQFDKELGGPPSSMQTGSAGPSLTGQQEDSRLATAPIRLRTYAAFPYK